MTEMNTRKTNGFFYLILVFIVLQGSKTNGFGIISSQTMNQIAQMCHFLLQRRERGRQILASMLNNLKLTFDLLNPVFRDHTERLNVYFLTCNLTIDGTKAAHAGLSN